MKGVKIPVLMYHRIGDPAFDGDVRYSISSLKFRLHMAALREAGWRAISLDDFLAWHRDELSLPEKSFLLTFDDGYSSVHTVATPVLKEYGWRATMFVVTDFIGGEDHWMRDFGPTPQRLLSTSELHEMVLSCWDVQSHSARHISLTKLSRIELFNDLKRSIDRLSSVLGDDVTCVAFPYGHYSSSVIDVAREVGFRAAFSVRPGFNRKGVDGYELRRIDVFGTDSSSVLLRKVRFGTNAGGFDTVLKYYANRMRALF